MTSLMVDLQGVDLGPVNVARKAITGVLDDPQVKKLLSGDAFETALGSLGSAMSSLKSSSPDAATMLKPIIDAVGSLASQVDPSAMPLGKYAKAVSDGAGMVVTFVGALQSNPASALGKLVSADQLTKAVEAITSGYSQGGGDPIGRFQSLVETVDRGVPSDPGELAKLAVEALLPFGGSGLTALRGGLDEILSASGSIALPQGRFAGLLLALDAVEAAAANPQQLAQALAKLESVRQSTIRVLIEDASQVRNAIASLRVAERLAPIANVAATIRAGEDGFLEILHRWRGMLDEARQQVENFDATQIRDFLNRLTTFLEDQARLRIEKPIDDSVLVAEQFVRGLFSHLPIRSFRAQITNFLATVAKTIRDAHLDVVAKDIHAAIAAIDHALDPDTLAAEFQTLLGDAKPVIDKVVNTIKKALQDVVDAINAIQTTLEAILQKVIKVLTAFSDAMTAITNTVNSLDVEGATDQTIASIHALREAATKLLSVAPLPEPMRPMVEQVISTLESIDFDMVFGPVEAALEKVKVPDDVKAKITSALQEVQSKLENAIPAQLIASINDEVEHVLDTIRSFDLNKLLDGVRKYLDEAATFLESLKVKDAAETIRGPFQTVLDAIDKVAPRKLLEPVISAYDSLLSNISVPSVSGVLGNLAGVINTFGESATQKLLAPMEKLTGAQANVSSGSSAGGSSAGSSGGGSSSGGSSAAGTGGSGGSALPANGLEPTPPTSTDVKPGDIIRLIGWLPNKLREALHALPDTVAGAVLREIDSVTAGLARDLRALRGVLLNVTARIESQLDTDLGLVADAQIRAQLAIHVHSAAGVDVNVSVMAVATINPGEMRLALASALGDVQDHARDAVGAVSGQTAVALDQAATALETFRLAGVVKSLDDLLAALDPEPLAADLDALAVAVLKKIPPLLQELENDLVDSFKKIQQLFEELNPATQAQKFLRILDVLRQELDVLNPGVLADELGGIHRAIRDAVAAYDPRLIAQDIDATLTHVAHSLRTLDVNHILGNINVLGPIVAMVEQANPATVLQHVGDDLKAVGDQLAKLDPAALLDAVEKLIPELEQGLRKAIEAIVAEIVALLESIKFASGQASASVQVTA